MHISLYKPSCCTVYVPCISYFLYLHVHYKPSRCTVYVPSISYFLYSHVHSRLIDLAVVQLGLAAVYSRLYRTRRCIQAQLVQNFPTALLSVNAIKYNPTLTTLCLQSCTFVNCWLITINLALMNNASHSLVWD